jgi:hypothetical protein
MPPKLTLPSNARPMVACMACRKGSCPLQVVIRSNKPDGVPAKCFACDKVYPVPNVSFGAIDHQDKKTKGWGKGRGKEDAPPKKAEEKEKNKQIAQLQQELAALKRNVVQTKPDKEGDDVQADDKQKARLKELDVQLRECRNIKPELRSRFGVDDEIAKLVAEKDDIIGAIRKAKPKDERIGSLEAFEKRIHNKVTSIQSEVEALEEEQRLVLDKLADKKKLLEETQTTLAKARKELAELLSPPAEGPSGRTTPSTPTFAAHAPAFLSGLLKLIDQEKIDGLCNSLGMDPKLLENEAAALVNVVASQAAAAPAAASASSGQQAVPSATQPVKVDGRPEEKQEKQEEEQAQADQEMADLDDDYEDFFDEDDSTPAEQRTAILEKLRARGKVRKTAAPAQGKGVRKLGK